MINEQIRDKEIRLIGENGEQLGIMSAKEAFKMAKEAELDLVKIAPTAKPPVCKIIDYGKYRYELARKEKEAKKKQKTVEIKEVRLSPNIEANDLNTKVNMAKKFIAKGDKVKVTLRFRGREMAHMQSSKHILDDFAEVFFATLGYASEVLIQQDKTGIDEDAVSVLIPNAAIYMPFAELVDIEKEVERLKKEKERLTKELARVNGMLANPNFVNKAPEKKIAEEKEKLENYTQMMARVEERLAHLSK